MVAMGSIHALCICVVESLDSYGKGTFVGKNVRGVTDGSRGERTASFRGETDSFVAL